jgi:predicted RNase H-like HicB family nuclease
MKYLVVVEQSGAGFSAYSPDLPGCVATAATQQAVEAEMAKAIKFHIEGLRAEGLDAPEPRTSSIYVDVPQGS